MSRITYICRFDELKYFYRVTFSFSLSDSGHFILHVVAMAAYGFVNCSACMQSLFVIKYVGTKNMNNGFTVIQLFAGVGVFIIPLVNEALLGHFGLQFDYLFYVGTGVVCVLVTAMAAVTKMAF